MSRRKPGPDPFGGARVIGRIPEEAKDLLDRVAGDAGMNRSSYVGLLITRDLGLPDPTWLRPDQDQIPGTEDVAISA